MLCFNWLPLFVCCGVTCFIVLMFVCCVTAWKYLVNSVVIRTLFVLFLFVILLFCLCLFVLTFDLGFYLLTRFVGWSIMEFGVCYLLLVLLFVLLHEVCLWADFCYFLALGYGLGACYVVIVGLRWSLGDLFWVCLIGCLRFCAALVFGLLCLFYFGCLRMVAVILIV